MLTYTRLLLLASWLGAALFFSAVVAPSVFAALRAFAVPNVGEIAGTIVTRTLSVINISGFVIGLIVLASGLASKEAPGKRIVIAEFISLIVLVITTGVGHWIIAARMRSLRLAMALPIDQVPVDDPRRLAFDKLHGYSVTALSIAMIAALISFGLIAYRARSNG